MSITFAVKTVNDIVYIINSQDKNLPLHSRSQVSLKRDQSLTCTIIVIYQTIFKVWYPCLAWRYCRLIHGIYTHARFHDLDVVAKSQWVGIGTQLIQLWIISTTIVNIFIWLDHNYCLILYCNSLPLLLLKSVRALTLSFQRYPVTFPFLFTDLYTEAGRSCPHIGHSVHCWRHTRQSRHTDHRDVYSSRRTSCYCKLETSQHLIKTNAQACSIWKIVSNCSVGKTCYLPASQRCLDFNWKIPTVLWFRVARDIVPTFPCGRLTKCQ